MTTLINKLKLLQQNCYLTVVCIFTVTKFSITQSILIYDGKADSEKKNSSETNFSTVNLFHLFVF